MEEEHRRRYALFLAMPDSEFVKKTYGGYFNVFVSTYGDEGDQWDLYRVVDGEFPGEKDLENYDGFVISGSSHGVFANDNDDWILKLCSILQKLDDMKKKVVGICFGHQIMCRVKGGKVGRASRGPDLGLRKITIVKESVKPAGYFGDEIPTSLAIIKWHQEEVLELPESAKVIAYSDKCDVEIFSIEDHFLGIQGHPECNREIFFENIHRDLDLKYIKQELADAAKATMEKTEPERYQITGEFCVTISRICKIQEATTSYASALDGSQRIDIKPTLSKTMALLKNYLLLNNNNKVDPFALPLVKLLTTKKRVNCMSLLQ